MLRFAGSLWFAAVLLMLLLVAMACATVYEATYTTERALAAFYRSWWFEGLLALVAVNMLASVVVRYPFSRRQIGFVLTHLGVLVTLVGAAVTASFGMDGQIGLFEGESTDSFSTDVDTLTVARLHDQRQASVDLTARAFSRFRQAERPAAPALMLGDLNVSVERFLPDSEWGQRVVDDDPNVHSAIEVSLSTSGTDDAVWLFDGEPGALGPVQAAYQSVSSADEVTRLLSISPDKQPGSSGVVRLEYEHATYEIPLNECTEQAVPIGDTGITVQVLRYLPHATVGKDKQLVNVTNQPINPAIEAEIVGPWGTERRLSFANFPDFESMHHKPQTEGLKLTFVAPLETAPETPIQVIGGPTGDVYVRFNRPHDVPEVHRLEVGVPVDSPWSDRKFAVLRRLEHARVRWVMDAVEPVRKERTPALLLTLSTPGHADRAWVQKHAARPVKVDGQAYELLYGGKQIPLGFELKLDRFDLGYYPGSMRPRSFESHVTVTDSMTGRSQSRVISMNHPVTHGGFSFYQSSYRQGKQRMASFLSVSRDPGQPMVFAGYVTTMLGMVVLLAQRMSDRKKAERLRKEG